MLPCVVTRRLRRTVTRTFQVLSPAASSHSHISCFFSVPRCLRYVGGDSSLAAAAVSPLAAQRRHSRLCRAVRRFVTRRLAAEEATGFRIESAHRPVPHHFVVGGALVQCPCGVVAFWLHRVTAQSLKLFGVLPPARKNTVILAVPTPCRDLYHRRVVTAARSLAAVAVSSLAPSLSLVT